MPLNVGYIEVGGGGATARIYYDATFTPAGPNQPLVNGPRGFCLDVTNTSGKDAQVVVGADKQSPLNVTVQQGDPVTTGGGRSRTLTEMAAAGFTTRGNVGMITIS